MEKSTRNLIVVAGVLVVGTVVYMIATRDKDKKKKGGDKKKKNTPDGTPLKMGYIGNGYIHISGTDRPKASILKVGGIVEITGGNDDMNGERTVAKIWKDSNGNVGAFKTKEFSVGYSTGKDRTYEDKAIIYVK
jgi:hypothetical protein